VLETVSELAIRRAAWVGHSFGGRLALSLAEAAPALVERLVLLDPALALEGAVALDLAEAERADRSFATREEAWARRAEEEPGAPGNVLDEELDQHLVASSDGRLRYRYCQSAVVAMYGELADSRNTVAAAVPTLLVRGAASEVVTDADVEALRTALGGRLEAVTVPGGHIVLWDAFAETAGAVEEFLARPAS
jgi:lipase